MQGGKLRRPGLLPGKDLLLAEFFLLLSLFRRSLSLLFLDQGSGAYFLDQGSGTYDRHLFRKGGHGPAKAQEPRCKYRSKGKGPDMFSRSGPLFCCHPIVYRFMLLFLMDHARFFSKERIYCSSISPL